MTQAIVAKRTARTERPRKALLGACLMVVAAGMAAYLMLAANSAAHAATIFTVNLTADTPDANLSDAVCDVNPTASDNQCTLRAAIQEANQRTDDLADTINFNIPTSGVATISPASALPTINGPVTIDGYSQPDSSPNTLEVGDNAVLKVELDGTKVPDASGLNIAPNSSGSVIRGLVINRFRTGIEVDGVSSVANRIEGNFIGTDPSGTLGDRGNSEDGVLILSGPSENVVGGVTPAARNVISANGNYGIFLGQTNANLIEGNYVGTDKSGTNDLGNAFGGVSVRSASGNTVGGTTAAARNVISANDFHGVDILGSDNKVLGNRIGTTASGTGALGNTFAGVFILSSTTNPSTNNFVGDGTRAGANTIAFNADDGVFVTDSSTAGNAISRNSIFSNAGLGIDLNGGVQDAAGVTANDAGDSDSGPNRLQNKPVLTSAKTVSGLTTIKGTLNSRPNQTYELQFFSNPSGEDEGKKFIGKKSVSTDGSGNGTFTFKPAAQVLVGRTITATATRNATGDTSEFSAARQVTAS
jgi:CSLREA domain-containing protein